MFVVFVPVKVLNPKWIIKWKFLNEDVDRLRHWWKKITLFCWSLNSPIYLLTVYWSSFVWPGPVEVECSALNCKEITVNLLAVISVHWNEKVFIIPQSRFFILPPSQKEHAICSNVHMQSRKANRQSNQVISGVGNPHKLCRPSLLVLLSM